MLKDNCSTGNYPFCFDVEENNKNAPQKIPYLDISKIFMNIRLAICSSLPFSLA